jgi:hypothetical protein
MIHEAAQFIDSNLNDFLKTQFSIEENIAIANSLLDINGGVLPENVNKVVLTFFNLSEENFLKKSKNQIMLIKIGREIVPFIFCFHQILLTIQ